LVQRGALEFASLDRHQFIVSVTGKEKHREAVLEHQAVQVETERGWRSGFQIRRQGEPQLEQGGKPGWYSLVLAMSTPYMGLDGERVLECDPLRGKESQESLTSLAMIVDTLRSYPVLHR
jgi:hypothetical protein